MDVARLGDRTAGVGVTHGKQAAGVVLGQEGSDSQANHPVGAQIPRVFLFVGESILSGSIRWSVPVVIWQVSFICSC